MHLPPLPILLLISIALAAPAWGDVPVPIGCETACLEPGAIVGTAGRDRLVGTPGDDILCGLEGDDLLRGGAGNDVLCGGSGDDQMSGGSGDDLVDGGDGDDQVRGYRGNDTLLGGEDEDTIDGGRGDDCIDGGDDTDRVRGRAGRDTCVAGENVLGCEQTSGSCGADPSDGRTIYDFAGGCYSVRLAGGAYLKRAGDDAFAFDEPNEGEATAFFLKASRLGSYLLFDDAEGHLVSDGVGLARATELLSDILLVDDTFESDAEWNVEGTDHGLFRLRHRKSGGYLSSDGLVPNTTGAQTAIVLKEASGCAVFPEEGTHTSGELQKVAFDDGDLFGFADVHTHIFQNFAFGGGGIIHGAPYHPLGVRHALPSCELFHGPEGRADLAGFAFDSSGSNIDPLEFLPALIAGELPEFNHETAGYPSFTDWPASNRSTHQTQYYRWLERAYLSGMRLVVQLASGNQILCDLFGGTGIQPLRYSCNDMVSVDRQIDEAYALQDYVDAQEGGPGRGWFQIATSPAEARSIIGDGKMAVVLGIEISNLFDCFLSPPEGFSRCTEDDVREQLDAYYERGIRVLFPVHKYDNGFSAGDGQKGLIEIGNILQTGHFSSFTQDCDQTVQANGFDGGQALGFPGANMPRADFLAPAPFDFSNFFEDLLGVVAPIVPNLLEPATGEPGFCQSHGLTELGEFLVEEMMWRGMIPDLAHLPRKSFKRAFEILEANDYPASDTHGRDNNGKLFALGGISQSGFRRCRNPNVPATTDDSFQQKLQRTIDNGGYPAVPFGFDLNGFAGAQGPRFGPRGCNNGQTDPVTYPFSSFAGDVTFHAPAVGERVLDFNTEGFVHIGLVAEMIQDVRGDGVTDAELEPLFRSAEGYVRMWEKAERRSEEMQAAGRAAIR